MAAFVIALRGAGTDLLNLISDILDLSKIESGTVTVESEEITFSHLCDILQRNFGHIAEGHRADLILVRANPLADIANVQQIDGVMVRGTWHAQDAIQARLDAIAASYEDGSR